MFLFILKQKQFFVYAFFVFWTEEKEKICLFCFRLVFLMRNSVNELFSYEIYGEKQDKMEKNTKHRKYK